MLFVGMKCVGLRHQNIGDISQIQVVLRAEIGRCEIEIFVSPLYTAIDIPEG